MTENNNKDSGVHHKTIFCVTTIARQIDGEYVFVRPEKAFTVEDSAKLMQLSLKNQFASNGKVSITVGNENIDCIAEIGIFEIELQEN